MTKYFMLLFAALGAVNNFYAQEQIKGHVMQLDNNGKHLPVVGANVYWVEAPIGTITNEKGMFAIPYKANYQNLIISYLGFKTDTLLISKPTDIHYILNPANRLDEVVVTQQKKALQKTYYTAQNVVTLNSDELLKAACCNLSESFETNPSIDVNFNDALTGTKQIQMLGLTSPYLLIAQENIPMVRGASQTFGLTFTPGTWVESIQITKGAGSVVNGYESISGQINTELVKPFTNAPLFVNAYANLNGRVELNTHFNFKLSNHWGTGLYVHANQRNKKMDGNTDGFLDLPLGQQINVQNRWQYQNANTGWISFVTLRYLQDSKQLGQVNFNPEIDKFSTTTWGSEIDTERLDASLKLGYVFKDLPFQSIGLQGAFSWHDQGSYFGFNQYNITHNSGYANIVFNSIISNTNHKFKTGLTFALDDYDELVNTTQFRRTDASAGAFFEYSYTNLEKLSLTAGLRADNHNQFGFFVTPRLHARYTPWPRASLRGSFGLGRRAANIFAENQRFFASSRSLVLSQNNGNIYGFNAEEAINFGFSFLQGFTLFNNPADVTLDFYSTSFKDRVVVDWENPNEINFYALNGKSFAHSLQAEFNFEPLPRLAIRNAYKWYNVQTQYNSGLLQQPLIAKNRFFTNVAYKTTPNTKGGQLKLDFTLHAVGEQRLPNTANNPQNFILGDSAPAFTLINFQITKVFNKAVELYLGAENLTNFTQQNPILGANEPFGANFDTTIVYAPIVGGMFYTGFRYTLKNKS